VAVASAGPYASHLYIAPDTSTSPLSFCRPDAHPAVCRPTNSVKALMAKSVLLLRPQVAVSECHCTGWRCMEGVVDGLANAASTGGFDWGRSNVFEMS